MTQPRPSFRSDAADSTPATGKPAQPSPHRTQIVAVHVLLVAFAVVVAWATLGRAPGTVADASVASAVAPPVAVIDPQSERESANRSRQTTTPHVVATPQPAAQVAASFAAAPIPRPEPAEPFDPMVAIPQPGAAFPPVMPADPRADPNDAYGGLYGTPGATRVVYVVDASGSLIDTLPFILNELQRALGELKPEQSFAVLFFSGDTVTEAPPVGMKRATTTAVTHTTQWIDPASGRLIANGPANANAAIRRALAYQPDAVILLSDGLIGRGPQALAQRAKLLSLIETANTVDVVFHTLQVRRPDPLASPTRLGTLELIALQSGGVHRYLGEDDLLPD